MLKEDQLSNKDALKQRNLNKEMQLLKFRGCGDIKKTMIMLEQAKQYYNDEWNQGNIRE